MESATKPTFNGLRLFRLLLYATRLLTFGPVFQGATSLGLISKFSAFADEQCTAFSRTKRRVASDW